MEVPKGVKPNPIGDWRSAYTICLMQSRKSRGARPVTNERRTYLVRFLVR